MSNQGNNTATAVNPALNTVFWVVTVTLLAVGIYGYNNFAVYFGTDSILYRVLALLAVAIVAIGIALQTSQGKAFWSLLKGARTEIRKVVWPTRQETTQTTMIVLLVVVVAGLILWGLDTGLGWLASIIIG